MNIENMTKDEKSLPRNSKNAPCFSYGDELEKLKRRLFVNLYRT